MVAHGSTALDRGVSVIWRGSGVAGGSRPKFARRYGTGGVAKDDEVDKGGL